MAGGTGGRVNSHALWYATRGTGIVALVLLTAVVVLGVAGSQRLRAPRWPRFLVVGLHRNLTLLTLAFLGLHILTTVVDSFAPVRLVDAVVPFVSTYRPVWVGLGAIAFDLLLALTATSLLRARIGHRQWRLLHWLAYAAWPVALAHALGTGSDARVAWLQALAAVSVLAVVAAVTVRLATAPAPAGRRLAGAGATVLTTVIGVAWYLGGPGAHGWAARAGTPRSLLAPVAAQGRVAAAAPSPQPAALPSPPYRVRLTGNLRTSVEQGRGLVLVSIRGRTTGGGGVRMTASGASFGPPSAPDAYVGRIVALEGTRLQLALRNGSGGRLTLDVALNLDPASHSVSGVVVAAPGDGESQ
jgi:DMSO/TMAO reductase YedYZ heme-binding membrane subunit